MPRCGIRSDRARWAPPLSLSRRYQRGRRQKPGRPGAPGRAEKWWINGWWWIDHGWLWFTSNNSWTGESITGESLLVNRFIQKIPQAITSNRFTSFITHGCWWSIPNHWLLVWFSNHGSYDDRWWIITMNHHSWIIDDGSYDYDGWWIS